MQQGTYLDELYKVEGRRIKETNLEIVIPNTSGKYMFPDNSILRNKTVVGLYFYEEADNSPVTDNDLADKAVQDNSFVTLKSNSVELLFMSPLAAFRITDTDRSIKPLWLDEMTPDQCYITVANAAGIPVVAGTSFFLTIIYLD